VPCLDDAVYADLLSRVTALGYTEAPRKVPQRCER